MWICILSLYFVGRATLLLIHVLVCGGGKRTYHHTHPRTCYGQGRKLCQLGGAAGSLRSAKSMTAVTRGLGCSVMRPIASTTGRLDLQADVGTPFSRGFSMRNLDA